MEKQLPFHSNTELDKLIDLLDSPEQLRMRINYLKNSGIQLDDSVEGFIDFYTDHEGKTDVIKAKLEKQEKRILNILPAAKNNWTTIRWAASILIITGSSLFFYFYKQQNNPIAITPYEEIGLANYMGENNSSKTDWKNIMVLYKNNDFKTLIGIQNKSKNDTLYYFQGVSAFKLNQFEKSIQLLNKIEKTSIFHNKSLYFKTLCYFKLENSKAFEKSLSEIKIEKKDPVLNEKVEELKKL